LLCNHENHPSPSLGGGEKLRKKMCGIIGIIGKSEVASRLVEGLKKLEYRGYDSAGIATIFENKIIRLRAEGKIVNLENLLTKNPVLGNAGIGHTRWATHGAPSEKNAHPHATGKVAVVHNGIIENYQNLRSELEGKGYKFHTETDTEVVPNLISYFLDNGKNPEEAVFSALKKLDGAYALGIIFASEPDCLYAARKGSPLAVGHGAGENFIGSDAMALVNLTNKISYLDEGDVAKITCDKVEIFDANATPVTRAITISNLSTLSMGKENYRHFMQKEIFEQPSVVGDNLHAYFNPHSSEIMLPQINFDLTKIEQITIVACGTSYYAGMVASYWFEKIAKTKTTTEIASEFRYREAILSKNGLAIFISQSGETADTLAALRYAKANGQKIVAIVNSVESTMAREADIVLPIYSGPEIGVASTKAFTAQLMTLAFLALKISEVKNIFAEKEFKELTSSLLEIPALMAKSLTLDGVIKQIASELSKAQDIIYIGRGVSFPLAMEGALKLKEVSYIHSEATAAGELKHGPIALIDENVPVIAIAPSDELFDKTASNIREVAARGGKIILISDEKGIKNLEDIAQAAVEMPFIDCNKSKFNCLISAPIIYAVPIQLLAYHVAVQKGTDVDQPRNLAKSVTVE
jgi:glucosamine--fructose-6-phosphate aminotransferase (isomerizing)